MLNGQGKYKPLGRKVDVNVDSGVFYDDDAVRFIPNNTQRIDLDIDGVVFSREFFHTILEKVARPVDQQDSTLFTYCQGIITIFFQAILFVILGMLIAWPIIDWWFIKLGYGSPFGY